MNKVTKDNLLFSLDECIAFLNSAEIDPDNGELECEEFYAAHKHCVKLLKNLQNRIEQERHDFQFFLCASNPSSHRFDNRKSEKKSWRNHSSGPSCDICLRKSHNDCEAPLAR